MVFKDHQLETGDFVAFQTETIPLPEVQAVVIDVENGVLEVMSTILTPFQHSGKFTEDEVEQIMVVYPAEIAIPKGSHGKFLRHQSVSTILRNGEEHQGIVIAAFDGVVVARENNGQLITGGDSHFNAIK